MYSGQKRVSSQLDLKRHNLKRHLLIQFWRETPVAIGLSFPAPISPSPHVVPLSFNWSILLWLADPILSALWLQCALRWHLHMQAHFLCYSDKAANINEEETWAAIHICSPPSPLRNASVLVLSHSLDETSHLLCDAWGWPRATAGSRGAFDINAGVDRQEVLWVPDRWRYWNGGALFNWFEQSAH